jgi:hypothetical protein
LIILVKKAWGLKDILKSTEDPGRKKGKPIGSYIDDLVGLQKSIVLCEMCERKFDFKRHHYAKPRGVPCWQGDCDACREFSPRAAFFIYEGNMAGCFAGRRSNRR